MKKYIVLILVSALSFGLSAQDDCPEPKKKAVKAFNASQTAGSYRDRYMLLQDAIKIDPNYLEAYDELAGINEKKASRADTPIKAQQYINRGLEYLHKIIDICPNYRGSYAPLKIATYYFNIREYSKAKPYFRRVMANPEVYKKDERYAYARLEDIEAYEKLIRDTVPFKPHKVIGPSTSKDEYLPMLSPDNRYLYFTRKMPDESKGSISGDDKELFVKSRRIGNGKYSSGIPMGNPFNLGQYQGGVSISVNNKLLFITLVDVIPYRGDNPAGYKQMFDNADIFFSEFKDGGWSQLESIGSNINTPTTWEAQPSISSDNKTLYFTRVIDPFGGDMDIYKSERQPNGSWGDPINLGAPINTPGDEKSPFMHSDSYTLYFSSTGHIGVGGYDIFYSKMNEQTGMFQRPINIGVPINTKKDEHGFIVSRNGDQAYYGSSEGKGKDKDYNIYSFELYEKARPKKITFVSGEILDNNGDVPEGAKVLLKNTKTNQEVEAVIDQNTGKYVAVITVNEGEDVLLTAKKEGYAFSSQLISSDEIVVGKSVQTKETKIKPIEVGEAYQINDINFATNSFEVTPRIMLILDEFIDFLNTNPTLKVAINGYTDNVGGADKNIALSNNRAKAVYQYLVIEEIDGKRLSYKGYGDKNPRASNKTESGRRKNRRTEFVIVEK